MKKYFMKGTDDEVQFGEVIELTMYGKEEGKMKHTHMEVEFCEEFVDELLEQDVIEEREVEDDLEDFGTCPELEDLDGRVTDLEEGLADLDDKLKEFTRLMKHQQEKLEQLLTSMVSNSADKAKKAKK